MKRIITILPSLLITSTLLAQPAGVSVSLTAAPGTESQVGNQITLTATVRTPGKGVLAPNATFSGYDRGRIRYTFKAHRNWPCAKDLTLAENRPATGGAGGILVVTHVSTYVWTPPAANAGEYTISVDVTYLTPSRLGSSPTELRPKPQAVGTATANYRVKPTPGWSGNVKFVFDPPSPATAPVSLNLTMSLYFPPEFRWYRWKYTCQGCSPGTQTKDHVYPATFQFQIPNAGNYIFPVTIDKVIQYQGQTDCTWEQTVQMPHTDPAYYYVNRP